MSKPLHVRIEFLGKGLEFILEPDQPFLIGRSDDVQVFIEDDSISVKHLELLWDGALLRVRDLDSSNGSFRMPQDGPFLEAFFGPQDRELHLRLAKVPVTLTWSDPNPGSEEKTQIAGQPKPAPSTAAPGLEPRHRPPPIRL